MERSRHEPVALDSIVEKQSSGHARPHGRRRAQRARRFSAQSRSTPVNRFEKSTTARQIRIERRSPSYWRVTFDHPPLNIFGPETMPQLTAIITALETDRDVRVVIFDSAIDGFFLTHYNFLAEPEETIGLLPGPTGLSPI